MNNIKAEITKLIEEKRESIRYARQYPVAKHQINTLKELGILDLMPAKFGHTDAAIVIEAAQNAGKAEGGFNTYGEGESWKTAASKLNTALQNRAIIDWSLPLYMIYGEI